MFLHVVIPDCVHFFHIECNVFNVMMPQPLIILYLSCDLMGCKFAEVRDNRSRDDSHCSTIHIVVTLTIKNLVQHGLFIHTLVL